MGGAELAECSKLVGNAWAAQRAFLVVASQCKKPADLMGLMKSCGVVDACQAAGKACKRGDFEHHYKTVSEGLGALNWLMIEPQPREMIEGQIGAADYSANKIRIKFKRNSDAFDANQHAFCDAFKKLLTDLMPYTKAHHLTGVAWNFKGGDAAGFKAQPTPAPAASAAASQPAAAAGAGADLAAEMAKLKDNAAAGLKKVTKDMQTWRKDFKADDAPPPPKPKAVPRPVVVKTKGVKQAGYKQQGMRWCVEAQTKEDGEVVVEVANSKQSVAIYGCFQAKIVVVGKCKGVTIDSCEQCEVTVGTTISAVELVNCKRMTVRITEKCPTVAIDKTDGCLTYLPATSLDTTFTTAKSSEMNVSFPDPKSAEGDLVECPIPEQFVHKVLFSGATPKMSAEVSELYS